MITPGEIMTHMWELWELATPVFRFYVVVDDLHLMDTGQIEYEILSDITIKCGHDWPLNIGVDIHTDTVEEALTLLWEKVEATTKDCPLIVSELRDDHELHGHELWYWDNKWIKVDDDV